MAKVLVIDDDETICRVLARIVRHLGHEAAYAVTLRDGLKEAQAQSFDVVLLDVKLPDGSGLAALPRFREIPAAPEVIIITGAGGLKGAELALKSGAWDYLEKPASGKEIILSLTRALQYREEKQSLRPPLVLKREAIIGDSASLRACLILLAQAATSDATVLISGETGTGKELFARAIHDNSPRANREFVVLDCAALPVTLAESLLFGYEKGAFTGADRAREGLIKQADRGTLFLDEVGEPPLPVQKAFLRVLQEKRFRPLGSKKEIRSDFRLVAATNRDLAQLVKEGQFRQDLLYRLQSLAIELPPLREHTEDIRPLTTHYLQRLCAHYRMGLKGFTPEFLEALVAYDWPGNVRELINALERVLAAAPQEPTLFPKHLPLNIRLQIAQTMADRASTLPDTLKETPPLEIAFPKIREFREVMDLEYLRCLLTRSGGNMMQACHYSGLSRSRLYALLKKHTLPSQSILS
ncbi:MAG: Fis family transcriptional regulator [Deltaproteobacteria bacterium RBG_13_58_19]|nr:MAG: Fis family transcriptional regulator [Deltaproteobacteria bacterium RBG_13_58_19]